MVYGTLCYRTQRIYKLLQLFFPTAATGKSITYERKAIPCASSVYWKEINTDSNNSTLDANLSETIIQIANYDKGTKQQQRKAIPSAYLKWVPGYLGANFYDTEQNKYNKNSFLPIRSKLTWKHKSILSHKGIVNPNVPTRAVQEPLERKALQSVWIAQLRWKRYTIGVRKNQDTSCTMVPEVCNNSTSHIEGYEAKEPSRLAL